MAEIKGYEGYTEEKKEPQTQVSHEIGNSNDILSETELRLGKLEGRLNSVLRKEDDLSPNLEKQENLVDLAMAIRAINGRIWQIGNRITLILDRLEL